MLDIDVEEELVQSVGGKFRLTTLIQKRLIEINRGAAPLVKVEEGMSLRRVVCEEILQGKIELSPRDQVGYSVETEKIAVEAEEVAAPAAEGASPDVEIYGSDIKKIKEQRIKELSQLLNPKK